MENLAHSLDRKATALALDYLKTEGQLLAVLSDMRRQKLFTDLNYQGVFDYCERKLGFSRAQAYYFKAVAEKADEVPEIKTAVVQGELTLSQARRIAPVVTKHNHREWIEKAKRLPQTELEREVTVHNPKAHVREKIRPIASEVSELKVAVDPTTEENLTALKDILSQRLRRPATLAEIVAWAADVCRDKFDPVQRAKRARSISSGNPIEPKRGRHRVQAAVKHPVVARDGMQCTYVSSDGRRCRQKRWLALHHVVEVSKGGLNTVDNLRTLCHAHHALVHSRPDPSG